MLAERQATSTRCAAPAHLRLKRPDPVAEAYCPALDAEMHRLISRPHRGLGRLVALLAVLGYASTAVVAVAASASPQLDRWEKLRAQDLRVASVAYRLSIANRALCPNALAPQSGFVIHSIEQYDTADQQGAMRHFELGSHVGVMAVVAGSPAQRSGLAADEQLVAVNGRPISLASTASDGSRSRATVALAQVILAEEMAKGAVTLRVSGAVGVHEVRFTADSGCASEVELVTSGKINAWADGQRIGVSDGIVAHCASDDDLALVIAHELAHNLLHHSERLAAVGSTGTRLGLTGTGLAEWREAEEEADRLGVRLASAAAYDMSNARSFLTALLDADSPGSAAGTHPASTRRLALLSAEIAAAGLERGQ